MRKKTIRLRFNKPLWFVLVGIMCCGFLLHGGVEQKSFTDAEIEQTVQKLMEEGDIPGLGLVIIRPDRPDLIKGFGYGDLEKKTPVTAETLFELGSCSKSFTGLAALQLASEGLLNLDAPVSAYLPWFWVTHKGKRYSDIPLRYFLHHTSGVPWNSIGRIPMGDGADQLEQAVKNLVGIELDEAPGTLFQYATINYDVIGLVIEKASGMSYADYMEKQVFPALGLNATVVGINKARETFGADKTALGHKIGFFAPRPYDAPPYTGNSPAGYIVSNSKDVARWLKVNLGTEETPLKPIIEKSHQRNESVPPSRNTLMSYAAGWMVSLSGSGEISHGGLNPNFTSQMIFFPGRGLAVGVLANSDSAYTDYIARKVLQQVQGIHDDQFSPPGGGIDKSASVVSLILTFFILLVLVYMGSIFLDLARGRRRFEAPTGLKIAKIFLGIPVLAPFLIGLYLIPDALAGLSWNMAVVWRPISFMAAVYLLVGGIGLSYLGYILSSFFPQQNKYLRSIPMLVLLSILSGLANSVLIFLISGSLFATTKLGYMLYYFSLAMLLYLLGRKVVQTRLTELTFDIVYDMRMKLIDRVFRTSYHRFEQMDRGRVFATLNDDTNQVGGSANVFVTLLTSLITIVGVFLYLATIAFWATLVTLVVIMAIATLYYFVSQKVQVFLEEARDTRNVYMRLLNGMLDGFKELSLHFKKRTQYRADVEKSTDEFRKKTVNGMVRFINAFMIGESMLVAVLGAVAFAVPRMFPNIGLFTLMSFIMALLYLIGPINGVLNSIPNIMQLQVAWNRVKGFVKDIPANLDPQELAQLNTDVKKVEKLEARGVIFNYENEEGESAFSLGPIDFEASKGEVVFIVGGNGSGKTTFAKLLTGLYVPNNGSITVDGQPVNNCQLGEYYSTVFTGFHLFEKLYNIDITDAGKRAEAEKYLEMLHLQEKVTFEGDSFSTIELSGGQKKRLALLQCYLEDCPIYLFDEVAADQDPEFRRFFYRTLLKRMKEKGKIVIAITHDDHYFDVADKVIKLDMGKVDVLKESSQYMLKASEN